MARFDVPQLAGLTYWTRYEKPVKDVQAEEERRKRSLQSIKEEEEGRARSLQPTDAVHLSTTNEGLKYSVPSKFEPRIKPNSTRKPDLKLVCLKLAFMYEN